MQKSKHIDNQLYIMYRCFYIIKSRLYWHLCSVKMFILGGYITKRNKNTMCDKLCNAFLSFSNIFPGVILYAKTAKNNTRLC